VLAEELGVSRGTLRVALKQLAYEGLVEYRPGRGVFVAKFRPQDAWEIYTLRNALEAMAARLAAERVMPDDQAVLADAIARIAEAANANDRASVAERERDFHRLVVRLARHGRLQAAYDVLDGQTRAFMARTMTDQFHPELDEVLELHASLSAAIAAGDTKRAEALASTHNTADGEVLVRQLADEASDS
jgi:DNA-binding GntR family transcriptional regulator